MAVPFGRLRLDVGRLIMVPPLAGILVLDLFSLENGAHHPVYAGEIVSSLGIQGLSAPRTRGNPRVAHRADLHVPRQNASSLFVLGKSWIASSVIMAKFREYAGLG